MQLRRIHSKNCGISTVTLTIIDDTMEGERRPALWTWVPVAKTRNQEKTSRVPVPILNKQSARRWYRVTQNLMEALVVEKV